MNTALIATVGQRFIVADMTCGHCEKAIAAELSKLEGLTRVVVDISTGTVITESVETLPIDVVAAAIDEAGYELVR